MKPTRTVFHHCSLEVEITISRPCRLEAGHTTNGPYYECEPVPPCNEWHGTGAHVCELEPPCLEGLDRHLAPRYERRQPQ